MSTLTPRIASELAEAVYQIRKPNIAGRYMFQTTSAVSDHFSFDLSKGPVTGQSGGVAGWFHKTSGFAIVGHGRGRYQNDTVVAVRGSKHGQDWLTNFHVGYAIGHNGGTVHSGFNRTFESMRPQFQQVLGNRFREAGRGTVHCVGHSLGGALATLTADWIHSHFRKPVKLYTFGAPRVGLQSAAQNTTGALTGIYRCTHGADPVPKVPVWPFIHSPTNRAEYRLDGDTGIKPDAHSMSAESVPGYRNTANQQEWSALQTASEGFLSNTVRLKYENRHQARFSGEWADRLSAALITLLKDAGYYTFVVTQASIGTSLTFYDMLARTLEKISAASARFAGQTRGLLGHMLVFAGFVTRELGKLTYRVIREVFRLAMGALYRAVRIAIDRD